jgi:anti-sigma regulatory factor (Ser/Thr protein kinase)
MSQSLLINLADASAVGEARRVAAELARRAGLDQTEMGQVSIVATEAANNVIKHAGRGQLLLRALDGEGVTGVEVLAVDKGPGMADITRCLRDGYSTCGSPGTGLGAIRRLSRFFDVYSQAETGTVLLAQLWSSKPAPPPGSRLEFGAVSVPKEHESACGDVWASKARADQAWIMVADGLGHGPLAAQAANEAARVFESDPGGAPHEILTQAHGLLRATRGASVAIAQIGFSECAVRYAGVGNIAGQILTGTESRSLVSHNGTLGHELHRVQEFTYPWPPDGLLVMHSDGLLTRWSINPYPGLAARHPAVIAGVLYRDFQRGRDDVTVVVARARR